MHAVQVTKPRSMKISLRLVVGYLILLYSPDVIIHVHCALKVNIKLLLFVSYELDILKFNKEIKKERYYGNFSFFFLDNNVS